jgi:hypothetical protein
MVPSDYGWTQTLDIIIQVFNFYAGFYYCLYLHYQVAKAILILILKHSDETMHIVGWHCAFKMLTTISRLKLLLISMFLFVSLIHRHLLSQDCLLSFSSGKCELYRGPRGHHKLWQNIDFIVMIIKLVWVVIYQQGNKKYLWKKCNKKLSSQIITYYFFLTR